MVLQKIIRLWDEVKDSQGVVERLIEENLSNKLDSYLKKYETREDLEGLVELHVDKNKSGRFNSKLIVKMDKDRFRYEREDYKKMDDLINHLFKHLKEELSQKPNYSKN